MKRLIRVIAVGILSLPMLVTSANAETAQTQCMEDQPCWDCTTMGNKICGEGFEEDLKEDADAAWEGLSMEEQTYLNSIGATDQQVIDFRYGARKLPEVLIELPHTL